MIDRVSSLDKVSTREGGWGQIVRDLFRAMINARFNGSEIALFGRAIELSLFAAKLAESEHPFPFKLCIKDVASNAGLDRTGVSRQFKQMIARRIFLDLGDGMYLINKDYRDWLDDKGHPLLSPTTLEWTLSARRYHKRGVKADPQTQGQESAFGGENSTCRTSGRAEKSPHSGSSPRTPIEETRAHVIAGALAELRVKEEKERETEEIPPYRGEAGGIEEEPFESSEDPGPLLALKLDPDVAPLLAWVSEHLTRAYPREESAVEVGVAYARSWFEDEGYSRPEVMAAVTTTLANHIEGQGFTRYASKVLHNNRARAGRAGATLAHPAHPFPASPNRAQSVRQRQVDAWNLESERRRQEADDGQSA